MKDNLQEPEHLEHYHEAPLPTQSKVFHSQIDY